MAGRPIDEKIVAMKMDNSDFKQKASETTSLFGKLQSALSKIPGINLGKTTKDLQGIQNAANNTNLNGLQKAAETVAVKFSNLGIVAITALSNITNRAVDAGLAMAKSLSVEPIMDGFHEYETKINSIGTIMSNTQWSGTTLKEVNAALADLNHYSDQTIYNFGQMTENIGRFTAAGVTLGDSTVAIKGLSNLAAASGSTTDQLNTAMYQMSQALSAGKIGLEDWNSVVNAGMGGKKFQDALIATAKSMGINTHQSNGFRMSLQKGWLTSKVMLATLKKFGNDKSMIEAATKVKTFTSLMDTLKESVGSGWATSWELMLGDFQKSGDRFTALNNAIGPIITAQAKARNDAIKKLADGGVFESIFKIVTNTIVAFSKVFQSISTGFSKAFPVGNVKTIKSLAEGIGKFADSLIPSAATLAKISTIAQAVGSNLKVLGGVLLAVGKAFYHLIAPTIGPLILTIWSYLSKLNISMVNFIQKVATSKDVINAVSTVMGWLSIAIKAVVGGAEYLGKAMLNIIPDDLGDKALKVINYVARLITSFGKGAKSGGDMHKSISGLGGIMAGLGVVFNKIGKGFSRFAKYVGEAGKSIGDYLNGVKVSLQPIADAFDRFFDAIAKGYNWIVTKVKEFANTVKEHMPNKTTLLGGGFLAAMVAITWKTFQTGKKVIDAFMSWAQLGEGIKGIMESTAGFIDTMGDSLKAFQMQVKAQALLIIAVAVGVLAASFLIMSKLNGTQIANGLYAIIGSLSAVVGAMAIMTKYDITGTGMKAAIQMVALAIAFDILSGALKKVSSMNWEEISKGLYGLVGTMAAFSGAMILMSKFGGPKVGASALQMVAMAGAMYLLLGVIKKLAGIDTEVLKKGVTTMGIILLEMGIFMKLAGSGKFGIGSTLGMLAVGKAIINITDAINEINKIKPENLKSGLKTIAAILGIVAGFTLVTGKMGLLGAGAGMLLLAVGLSALIVPIAILGNMKIDTLVKGLGAIAVALGAIAAANMFMGGLAATGAGLILMAIGLTALTIPIAILGHMPWQVLAIGIGAVAVSLLLIGGISLLLSEAVPIIALFGASILALGAGMALAGVGFSLFGTGLVTLAGLSAGAITTIVSVLGTLLVGLASLIPMAVNFVIKLVIQIADALAKNAPTLIDKIGLLIVELINGLAKWLPPMIEAAVNFIVKLVDGMATALDDHGQDLVNAVMRLVGEILVLIIEAGVSVIEALFGWIPGVKGATEKIGKTATKTIRDTFGASEVGKTKGKDFANGLSGQSGAAGSAGSKVSSAAKTGAHSANLTTAGSAKGSEFANGLSSKISAATSKGKALANGGKSGAGSVSLSDTGSHFGSGFASGISSALGKVKSAALSLARTAKEKVQHWLDIHSPSRVMKAIGGFFGDGFAVGISDKAKQVGDSAKSLAVTARDSVNQFMDSFQLPGDDNELQFNAVINYDQLDTSKFGSVGSLSVKPNTSLTAGIASAIVPSNVAKAINVSQNGNNSALAKQQAEQINLLKQQNGLLSNISQKDNSLYLDSKEIYNSNKSIQNNQTIVRNIFKGVTST